MRATIKSKYEKFKQQAYIIIYGTNTLQGKLFDILLLFFILVSSALVMLESVKNIDVKYHNLLIILEWIITIFFSIEYILRIVSNDKPLRYIFSFYGIVDLLSILPVYLSIFIPGSKMLATIRIIRLLRIFRILSLVKFTHQAQELRVAIKESRAKILVFIYFVLVLCVLLGTIMYMIEGEQSGFNSIPHSVYWCIVTLTTVGYGDIAPVTPWGQAIASLIMILGYGIIAVPTGIVSSEYSRVRNKKHCIDDNENSIQHTEKECVMCSEKNFPKGAIYCHKCGSLL